jgi:HSP20 family protein
MDSTTALLTRKSDLDSLRKRTYTPRVDIFETEEQVTLYVDLPGVRMEDLDLHFEDHELSLHAQVASRKGSGKFVWCEYGPGDFHRVFRISEEIEANGISAALKNGVLTLQLPKSERVRSRKIAVHPSS